MFKKYFYYFVIIVVLINNYALVKKYDTNTEKYKSLISQDKKEENIVESIIYLHKIGDSKYIDDISNIDVSGSHINVSVELKKGDKHKDIVTDFEKIFGKKTSHVNVIDDKNMILEFD